MPKAPVGRIELVSQRPIGVTEASAVAALGGDEFFVVGDEDGIHRCRPGKPPVPIAAGDLTDLEGFCLTHDGAAYALAERDGGVWRFRVDHRELRAGEYLGALQAIGDDDNHGWEGLAYAKAGDDAVLVAVHQASPRRVGLFDPVTLAERATLRLPKAARKTFGDLNDVTIDRRTGHLFVLSGKAGLIAELRLANQELDLVQLYPIETSKRDVPEGIDLDAEGRLWVVTDGEGMLRELRLS